ncbi:DUF2309 family protein [bacterium]|nr:DUF2309 family protein [bacterium]
MTIGLKSKPLKQKQVQVDKVDIMEVIAQASDIVAPVWPLKNFIAVNPLQGLENLPFETAIAESGRIRNSVKNSSPGFDAVNRETIKWCSAFFDDGQATLAMPGRQAGLYRCFADLARFDQRLNRSAADDNFLKRLPGAPSVAIELCLDKLDIPGSQRSEFIRQSLAALPGWAGYLKWKSNWQSPEEYAKLPASLVDFVAVRLVLTCLLSPDATLDKSLEPSAPVNLDGIVAKENEFRDSLLRKLLPFAVRTEDKSLDRPKAQLVFCIDVRSEPFRRTIEAQNDYETLGFAGFFGIPVRIKPFGESHAHDSCPVLLKPGHEVEEHACSTHADRAEQYKKGRGLLSTWKGFYQSLKYNFATPFALVEMLGPWCGLSMMAKTFATHRYGRFRLSTADRFMPEVAVTPGLDHIEISRQADFGEQALRMMGLTARFAPLVVLCGHGSTTENNAFASALDCGACGGNHGGANARILASILNSDGVREILAERGIRIPSDTLFLAAEHDTTTDEMTLFEVEEMSGVEAELVASLRNDLAQARIENSFARSRNFDSKAIDSSEAFEITSLRSQDWAQVRPEWGLARNAAFVVGPRGLTSQMNLEGRCFLHSYDWQADTDGKFLTTILTAPMVVAQWINSQYFFSTIDPVAFGAGSKVTHNVTGKIGVMQGNASDLMHGLPLQSVYSSDETPYHEPMRLLTVVQAPKLRVDEIVRSQAVLQKLFGNGWVQLVCIDPTDGHAYLLSRDFEWQKQVF